jgi:ABC-type transport system substrate-binding protein
MTFSSLADHSPPRPGPSVRRLVILVMALVTAACGKVWNDPYPAEYAGESVLYSAFTERPKHLDPARAYSEDEYTFINQIYEPPLQYHYLKRPYTLIPAAADAVPTPRYYDSNGTELPADADGRDIARSVYDIRIKPGIRYAPHPAFALDSQGNPRYFGAHTADEPDPRTLDAFKERQSRELVAADFVYGLKRLAHPGVHSPIFSLMAGHIVGLKETGEALAKDMQPGKWLDLDPYPLVGAQVLDRYTYRITLRGKYPQFQYWLAMPFFAPVPREADRFYAAPGMAERNLTLDWWPIGTGPYTLSENNPNSRMVLARNPNFHGELYPGEGEPDDAAAGLLKDAGKPLPLIDTVVFSREKESIPYWNKFLQGYYDASGIASDSFDQAVRVSVSGDIGLTDEMRARDIRLLTSVRASIFYLGFNMADAVVGADGERGRALRQAISIALDQEEFISIFLNGRGVAGMGPIPPGIFGYVDGEAGINPVVYDWVDGKPRRKSVEHARTLLAKAGYPNGRDSKTGEPLVLNLDTTSAGMGDKAKLDWLNRQFKKLDIQLVVRSTDFNRFQEKIRKGAVQMFYLGWNADYPDPENFLFLLNGKETRIDHQGENSANYRNPDYDRLFEKMKNMDNSPERLTVVRQMVAMLQQDAPWVFGFHPKTYALSHAWLKNRKPNDVANNTLKYQRIDADLRARARRDWNRPVLWPLFAIGALIVSVLLPAVIGFRRRERSAARFERS